jgi:hypothetical protein
MREILSEWNGGRREVESSTYEREGRKVKAEKASER